MENERILYPCYFRRGLTRRQGRRIHRAMALEHPKKADISDAVRRMGLEMRVEESHHPGHWMEREGRIVVEWPGSKEELIRAVARKMKKGK